jgi:hypothetical protein
VLRTINLRRGGGIKKEKERRRNPKGDATSIIKNSKGASELASTHFLKVLNPSFQTSS